MPTAEENELMTRVGRGTPAGEMLRRYWWPVGFTQEVRLEGPPARARLLGEDLVLFRDGQGRLGLLGLHCSHRGTSLEYGRVEAPGIRCCYHGWLYDADGRCLDQPAEPEDSTFKDRIHHPAYRVEELGGLIFGYLGPNPTPLLPRYRDPRPHQQPDHRFRCRHGGDGGAGLTNPRGRCWRFSNERLVMGTAVPFRHDRDLCDRASVRASNWRSMKGATSPPVEYVSSSRHAEEPARL